MYLVVDPAIQLPTAFPTASRSDLDAVALVLASDEMSWSGAGVGPITIDGFVAHIPQRILSAVPIPEARGHLSDHQACILDCLFTRHNDGYVRQASLERVLSAEHAFVPAFVIQLVGEYVFEILLSIQSRFEELDLHLYSRFAQENPLFLELTRRRVTSYWDCYFRADARCKEEYLGWRLLDAIEGGSGSSR